MEIINQPNIKNQVLGKWLNRIVESHEYCAYCGKQKKAYIRPGDGHLFPMDCMCARELKNFTCSLEGSLGAQEGIIRAQYKITERCQQEKNRKTTFDEAKYIAESNEVLEMIEEGISQIKNRNLKWLNANHREGVEHVNRQTD